MTAVRLAVVSAGLGDPSSSHLLADALTEQTVLALAARGRQSAVDVVRLAEHGQDVMTRLLTGFASAGLTDVIDTVTGADGLIVVTPVYATSCSGLFTAFVDVLDPDSLVAMPVLLAATGGTERHSLAIDYALRPLFAYLRTQAVPTGVFAATSDWGAAPTGTDLPLVRRVARAADELAGQVAASAGTRRRGDAMALPAGFDPTGGQVGRSA